MDFWESLISDIDSIQGVVPIIGRELIVVGTGEIEERLDHVVARLLVPRIALSSDALKHLKAGFDVNDVVCAHYNDSGPKKPFRQIAMEVVEILRKLKPKVPEALAKLIAIPAFSLFITTTFDGLLEQAIRQQVKSCTKIDRIPRQKQIDELENAGAHTNEQAFCFALFGSSVGSECPALTDAEMLHDIHKFAASAESVGLVRFLEQKHLLFVGVDFPDWLVRFLIKATRGKCALHVPGRESKEYIVTSASAPPPPDLVAFLTRFNKNDTLFCETSSCSEFVSELHSRWFEDDERKSRRRPPLPAAAADPVQKKVSVFLSYSHEPSRPHHRPRVHDLAKRLKDLGEFDVKFDQDFEEQRGPNETWKIWSENQIKYCTKVLVIGSKSYYESWWDGENSQGFGKGAGAEATAIRLGNERQMTACAALIQADDETDMPDQLHSGFFCLYKPDLEKEFDALVAWLRLPPSNE